MDVVRLDVFADGGCADEGTAAVGSNHGVQKRAS